MSRRPVPLMFIKSPSVILKEPIKYEESTSIFVKDESSEKTQEPIVENEQKSIVENKKVLPSVENQLNKIQSPFGRHLYQPLQIKVAGEQDFLGKIEKVEGDEIFFKAEENEEAITIQTFEVLDILWRGKSIPER